MNLNISRSVFRNINSPLKGNPSKVAEELFEWVASTIESADKVNSLLNRPLPENIEGLKIISQSINEKILAIVFSEDGHNVFCFYDTSEAWDKQKEKWGLE